MLSALECRKILRNFRYKDNWTFSCRLMAGNPHIIFIYKVMDAEKEGQLTTIKNVFLVEKRIRTEAGLLKWLYNHILMFEIHEAEEWIRFKNERPFYPHKKAA